ncbi:MAG: hypothetical protein ACE5IF_05570 [Candidatus Bathyarchaeia archaeon]
MEWKTFGMKRRLVSARQKVSKVLRLIGSLRREDSNVSSPTPVLAAAPYETVNPLTNYSREAELKKARALAYWRMWDRLK